MDELTLHRYLDGRLDERERSAVETALRSDPSARRTLDALREEATLIGTALEAGSEPVSGVGRIGSRVVAQLHQEERSRISKLRTRKMFWRVASASLFAAGLVLCFLLVSPRTPAGSLLSGTQATVTVHGDTRKAWKGAHLYDGDSLRTDKGQFVRIGLAGSQSVDVDEFSEISIEKSGAGTNAKPLLRLVRGRIGVVVADGQNAVQIELTQGLVTVHPGSRADIWLPENTTGAGTRLPEIFFAPQAATAGVTAVQAAPAFVTLFDGYALVACAKNGLSMTARRGMRVQLTKTECQARWVNLAGSRVLNARGDDGLHTRDNLTLTEWTLLGVMEKPQFEVLGRRWGLSASLAVGGPDTSGTSRITDALRQLDAAMQIAAHAERAEKIAAAQQALRQACEVLPQNDERRRLALTLEGLAHFEEGCARFNAGGQKGSDPLVSFEAARVAFDAALTPDPVVNGTPALGAAADWRASFASATIAGYGSPPFASMPPEAQSALTASFFRSVTTAWSARVMPPQIAAIDAGGAAKDDTILSAAKGFAQLHDDLGHTVEGLAALLGEALCEMRADDAVSRRKALDALQVIVSTPLAGTDGPARQAFEGIRSAALIALVKLNASGNEAQKTLDAAHDYELLNPLEANAERTKEVRALLMQGLELQKASAMKEKRFDNAIEACDALLVALDEGEGHWLDAGQRDRLTTSEENGGALRHIAVRLDRLEALIGTQDWLRASGEGEILRGNVPADLKPRFEALLARIRAGQKSPAPKPAN